MTEQQVYSHHRNSRATWHYHYLPIFLFAMLVMALIVTQEAKGTLSQSVQSAYAGTGSGQAVPAGGTATATPQCTPSAGWNIVSSPNHTGAANNYLNAVSALGPNDIWAVGYWYNSSPAKTLIEHWDGTQWSVVPSPDPGASRNELYGVTAIAPNDVWAVGTFFEVVGSDNVYHTLTLHWDGLIWTYIPSPNLGTWNNILRAATAVSSNDVWAVGSYVASLSSPETVLALHWNGTQWLDRSPITNPGSSYNILYGVDASSTNDLWAVGYYNTANGAAPLTMHWVGTKWNYIPSPIGTGRFNRLNAVDVIAPNDAWAVGYNNPDPGGAGNVVLTLIAHWNGAQWTQVSSPSPGTSSNYLYGVTAIAPNDIWAAGYNKSGTGPIETLTEHWNGTAWSTVPSPNTGTSVNWLTGIDAVSATDVWAVGYSGNANTLALRYTSTGCATPSVVATATRTATSINSPVSTSLPTATGTIGAPTATSTALAATATPTCQSTPGFRDVIIRDYEYWPQQNITVTVGTTVRWLNDGPSPHTATSDTGVWDSGVLDPGQAYQYQTGTPGTFPYHCTLHPGMVGSITVLAGCPPTITPTSTGTPTGIAGSATATRTGIPTQTTPLGTATSTSTRTSTAQMPIDTRVPTSTATQTVAVTATSTACTITFTDVHPDNVFYTFIRCLACRGIISGYDAGTFRPFNDITRGQIAKIVSNAAGFSEDPGPQIYEDVPTGSPFYRWINRLSMRGHIGGYPCGLVPEEPCVEPDNLPYFRPANSATRGQLAKIVANAAGLSKTPSGQFYTDVPEGHTFYVWIMRLTDEGAMSGYDCGGEGEPCDSENRPYFRPFNNVTRGQASKIVANTFFPGCQTPARR
jgi:plastocyanin